MAGQLQHRRTRPVTVVGDDAELRTAIQRRDAHLHARQCGRWRRGGRLPVGRVAARAGAQAVDVAAVRAGTPTLAPDAAVTAGGWPPRATPAP